MTQGEGQALDDAMRHSDDAMLSINEAMLLHACIMQLDGGTIQYEIRK